MAALAGPSFEPEFLSPFESAFVSTVLEHRGLGYRPSLAEFAAALDVLRRYDQQRAGDPPEADPWQPQVGPEALAALAAKTFLMFGATRPTPAQWQRAHAALFGPLAGEVFL